MDIIIFLAICGLFLILYIVMFFKFFNLCEDVAKIANTLQIQNEKVYYDLDLNGISPSDIAKIVENFDKTSAQSSSEPPWKMSTEEADKIRERLKAKDAQ